MSCEGCPSAGKCSKDPKSCGVQPNPENKIRAIVPIMSGKGGVGKSTVTVLLARALRRMGLSVGVFDADVTGPSIPRLLGLQGEQAYSDARNFVLPVVSEDGIKTMSLNYMMAYEADPVVWRGPIVSNLLKQFYTDVLWGELDVLLIDMPPGTSDTALTILQDLPVTGVVMVTTPQAMVSMIVTKAVRMCEKMEIPVLGMVENMAYMKCPHCEERINFYPVDENGNFKDLEGLEGVKMYAILPMNELLRQANEYDAFNLKQQEEVSELFDTFARTLNADLDAIVDAKEKAGK